MVIYCETISLLSPSGLSSSSGREDDCMFTDVSTTMEGCMVRRILLYSEMQYMD